MRRAYSTPTYLLLPVDNTILILSSMEGHILLRGGGDEVGWVTSGAASVFKTPKLPSFRSDISSTLSFINFD